MILPNLIRKECPSPFPINLNVRENEIATTSTTNTTMKIQKKSWKRDGRGIWIE